ncbi:MAG: 50S ribosomal protein L22 [Nitrospirae bacterium]|nr:50S ribosomal protein L22 [Candidatus Manganitrophaceae bacterium]
MEAKAILRFVRVAPRKARLVVDLIRGKSAAEALIILKFTPRHAARVVEKILKSAVANATQKEMGDVDTLQVSKVFVDGGPVMKRMQPRAMGRANIIRHRTSHITLIISGSENGLKKPKASRVAPAAETKVVEEKPAAKRTVKKKTAAKKTTAKKSEKTEKKPEKKSGKKKTEGKSAAADKEK